MVRLTRFNRLQIKRWKDISIPSGTIKSKSDKGNNATITKFQFLLVRLKVQSSLGGLIPQSYFNSFWYD